MSNVEPMAMESEVKKDIVFAEPENSTSDIQPRSIPYTPAQRRNYIHRARLEALQDDSNEFEDFIPIFRGKTASAYDSSDEDTEEEYESMQRAARRPFQRLRNYFRPNQSPNFKAVDDEPTQRPTFLNRFRTLFRQAPASTPRPRPMTKPPQVKQNTKEESKYQVLFWPIKSTNSDGVTTTNLVPHLVVRNPEREEEILYAVPLVKLAQNGDVNIFHAAGDQEVNSIKKIKSKGKKQKKNKNKKRKNRPQPADEEDEVMMMPEPIIQSEPDVEDETTTTKPPSVPSFIFVGDTPDTAADDAFDEEVDTDVAPFHDKRYRSKGYGHYRNRNYYYRKHL